MSTRTALLALLLASCTEDKPGHPPTTPTTPTTPTPQPTTPAPTTPPPTTAPEVLRAYTYTLAEGTADLPVWTTPPTAKVRTTDAAPALVESGLYLSAARGEFEPVQIVLAPGTGQVAGAVDPFADLAAAEVTLAVATYEVVVAYDAGWAEHLVPPAPGDVVRRDPGAPTPIWVTVRVPDDAPPGEHATTLHLTPDTGAPVDVPVVLYVFDFALPAEVHFGSRISVDQAALVGPGGTDDAKDVLFEHRLTPDVVTWPSSLSWAITWDADTNPQRCTAFWDEPDQPDEYAIGWLAPRYILGTGWNGIGFPTAEAFHPVAPGVPRPDVFCGEARGDGFGTDAYNTAWSAWLAALDGYLVDHALDTKSYATLVVEPQSDEDLQVAAFLCALTRSAAPDLRRAIYEEPKPEIAEDADTPCAYDRWIAHVQAYEQGYAWSRQSAGEEVWLYTIEGDHDPWFDPTRIDASGTYARIVPWAAWSARATGWSWPGGTGSFFDGPKPTVRAELLREGFEDYEYLWLANGGAAPAVGVDGPVDAMVRTVAPTLTTWTRDADALMVLRDALGRYIEGSRATLPVLRAETTIRPRAAYYLNFQEPTGEPTDDPLVVDGRTYAKVGWEPWDPTAGSGWYLSDAPHQTLYVDASGYSEVEKSCVYDDSGRPNLFEYALENGRYAVTVGVGRPGFAGGDPTNVDVEGQPLFDDEVVDSVVTRTVTVDLTDGYLSIAIGGHSELVRTGAWTFLTHVDIVPVDAQVR